MQISKTVEATNNKGDTGRGLISSLNKKKMPAHLNVYFFSRNDAPTDVEHTNMCNDRIRNFTNLSNQIYSPDCKPDLTSPLSRGLWDFFQKSRQKRSIYEAKIKLWAKFEKEFQSMWQKSR